MIEDRKSGCGYTWVVVLKRGCVIDAKICMSQGKIRKTVIALEKKHDFIMETLLIYI